MSVAALRSTIAARRSREIGAATLRSCLRCASSTPSKAAPPPPPPPPPPASTSASPPVAPPADPHPESPTGAPSSQHAGSQATTTPLAPLPRHNPATRILQQKSAFDPLEATATPLYQTATFGGLHTGQRPYDYTRSGNPTRDMLETLMAELEGVKPRGAAFTSGMAALTAVLRATTVPGDHIVAGADLYGGLHRLLRFACQQYGVRVTFADLTRPASVAAALQPGTKLVFAESPTNPSMQVVDIRALCAQAHNIQALVCVDNSLMGPLLMQPHLLGADIVVNSATKFINGHSDVMAGIVTCTEAELAQKIHYVQNAEGAGLSPFDCWLVLRGVKTLPVRQQRAQRSAELLAKFLRNHRLVGEVNYLHPDDVRMQSQAQLHFSQARGGGAVLSFVPACGTAEFAHQLLSNVKLFKTSVSFGSVHSLIEMPARHSHASIPSDQRHLSDALIRISVGLEDVNDLMSDLGQALHQTAEKEAPQLIEFKLGCPLPAHEPLHACGTAMPKWQDVVGYEEADPRVHNSLVCGYPRFVYPPYVVELMDALHDRYAADKTSNEEVVIPTASARVALRLQEFVAGATAPRPVQGRIHDLDFQGMCAVVLPRAAAPLAKTYWQHTGELVSSRMAAEALSFLEETWPPQATVSTMGGFNATQQLRRRLAGLLSQDERNVFLFPSGMAAIATATRTVQRTFAGKIAAEKTKWVVLGFPYLDTLKLLRHPQLSPGVHFLPSGSTHELADLLQREPVLGIMTEYPSNPLLKTVDLRAVRALGDQYMLPLIVDDSIGGCCNVDLLGADGADLLVSSLTKSFNGSGNAMGGSLAFNPHSELYHTLRHYFDQSYEPLLYHEDAQVLLGNAADLEARNAQICATAERLADTLAQHPAVAQVYYPKFIDASNYRAYARHGGRDVAGVNWGGLMSIVLKDPSKAEAVYDALPVAKGPGFGTNFTLVCPYTLLAHYHELDFARLAGVDPSLLRVWVGLEPADDLIQAFCHAIDAAHAQ